MANIIKRVWNQNRMVQIEDLKGMTFQAEAAGHTFQISGIDDEGNTVALTGTPSGVLLRPDNTDVALTCSVSGGVVSATLPANCYDVPGRFGLTIFITSGSSKTAIYAAVGTVTRTSSGTVAPGTSQSVVDLINAINAAVNSIPASYSALLADIAPTYSNSALYSVGQYAWYDGDLKRCIVPITTAESYTAAHWTSAVLGQDVSDLKSAFDAVSQCKNLCGMDANVLYPVPNIKDMYITMSTSDGSNMTNQYFYLYCYGKDKQQLSGNRGYYKFVSGNASYTHHTYSDQDIYYVKWSANYSVPLQVEIGQTATAYEPYWGNTKYLSYLEQEVETLNDAISELDPEVEALEPRVDALETMTESLESSVSGAIEDITDITEGLENVFYQEMSPNLFDNDFDESGYINPSTGQDAAASGYIRSSKYYELDDLSVPILYVLLSPATATFIILFYDSSKTYISYESANNLTYEEISIPANTKYFRVYGRADYESSAYVGTVSVNRIIPYGVEEYNYKNNSITPDKFSKTIIDEYNLVDNIIDDTYLNKANGNTSAFDAYRASDLIAVDASTVYYLGLFNRSYAPTHEFHAVTVCFYNSSGTFISNSSVYSSDNTHDNCTWDGGFIKFTTPANTSFVKIGANDSADPFLWLLAKTSAPVLYSKKDGIKMSAVSLNDDLQGKLIAVFGDSIMGNTRNSTSTPSYISEATGATVLNFGFGGCRMSVHSGDWDKCSMYRLADDVYNESFSDLVSAVTTGWSGMPGYFRDTAAWLAACDFSKVDAILIAYGTNDYRETTSVLDNQSNKFDTSTVCGALRYSIRQILSKYPRIQILVTCPIFRTFFQEGTTTPDEYSDTKDWGSGTLLQYAEAFKQACADMNVPFLDLYHETSFNPYTRLYFYPADDGTHPNEKGRERIGNIIGGRLMTLLPSN